MIVMVFSLLTAQGYAIKPLYSQAFLSIFFVFWRFFFFAGRAAALSLMAHYSTPRPRRGMPPEPIPAARGLFYGRAPPLR
ncbi:MAG: hypothetical protein Q4A66_06235, partial [Eubacteriales bacterium]|nr:hypothetical protein [Eubacteriales bacterium]